MPPAEPPARARLRSNFNLSFVLTALQRAGLITPAQRTEIASREAYLKQHLTKLHDGGKNYDVSPVEMVAVAAPPVPGKPGAVLDEDAISEAVARDAGVGYRKIDPLKLDMALITRTLSRPYAERHVALPLQAVDGRLIVAVANPFDAELFELLAQRAGMPVDAVLSSKSDILRSIEHVYGFKQSVAAVADGGFVAPPVANFEQLVKLSGEHQLDATDRPVIAAVDYLLRYAFEQRASDIHLEPTRGGTSVRLRIDGVLHPVFTLPKGVHEPLLSRLKMLARLDIAEKRRPQDGRIKSERAGKEVEMRVSTIPTAFGEKMVMRIFDPDAIAKDLTAIGFADDERATFESWIDRPHGMLLVTGPTGSGKTTTLYSSLRILAGPVSAPRDLRCYLGGIIALFVITCFASPYLLERPAPGAAGGSRQEVPAAARPYYDRAVNGDAGAMRILGNMYCQGLDVPRDIQEGIQWYHRAVAAGSREAVRDLERLGQPLSN